MKIDSWLAFKRRHFNFKVDKISGGKLSRDRYDESESKIIVEDTVTDDTVFGLEI